MLTQKKKVSKINHMRENIKKEIAEPIKKFRMPRYNELPDGGLYLEQIVQYMNQILEPLGCVSITASMISNYVKKGMISGAVKKRYHANQIAYLFFITIAKNTISLEHIHMLVEMQKLTYTDEVAYDYFCSELENMLFYLFGIKDVLDEIGITNSDEKMMLRAVIVAASNSIHLTNYFNALQAEKSE